MSGFQVGLCSCCEAGTLPCLLVFCCGCSCVPYAQAMVQQDSSKNCVLEGVKAMCFCCSCQRGEFREKYGIEGGFVGDLLTTWCCYCCAGLQMLGESNKRGGQ